MPCWWSKTACGSWPVFQRSGPTANLTHRPVRTVAVVGPGIWPCWVTHGPFMIVGRVFSWDWKPLRTVPNSRQLNGDDSWQLQPQTTALFVKDLHRQTIFRERSSISHLNKKEHHHLEKWWLGFGDMLVSLGNFPTSTVKEWESWSRSA